MAALSPRQRREVLKRSQKVRKCSNSRGTRHILDSSAASVGRACVGEAVSRRYVFGRFDIRPDERRILESGVPVALGARAFDLLLALVERRDRVVGKDELLAVVWPGVAVEEGNLTVQVSALRKLLGTEAINTVPGRGYRFTLPSGEPGEPSSGEAGTPEAAALGSGKPSIAVLPFANMSGDPDHEYFADGITEDIITDLSRFHSLFVIARNSSFTYKGKSVDVRAVAREMGVRYVLEGSVRKLADRLRVTAQLIDAQTGTHLWAERYDRVLDDIFVVQEEITRSIVGAIAPQIDAEERSLARRRSGSLSAYELALRANADAIEAGIKADHGLWELALAKAREVLSIDPDNETALEMIAAHQCHSFFSFLGTEAQTQAGWREGEAAATRLIEVDPSRSTGYAWKGMLLSLAGRHIEALANARRANSLNPNDAVALTILAFAELLIGHPESALEHARESMRLSPRDRLHIQTRNIQASACFLLRRHSEGLDHALQAVSAAPNFPVAHLNHALVAVGGGDIAAANAAFEKARTLAPKYTQSRIDIAGPSIYFRPEDARSVRLALRIAAGLEDPDAARALR